jgi:hypothetical protein
MKMLEFYEGFFNTSKLVILDNDRTILGVAQKYMGPKTMQLKKW